MDSTHVVLIALSALILLIVSALYAHLTVGLHRNRGLRAAFLAATVGLLVVMAAVNLRADQRIQSHARRLLCKQRLTRLGELLHASRRLHGGGLPATLEALEELPDFRREMLRSPMGDQPYLYTRSADGLSAVVSTRPGPLGYHRMTVAPGQLSRPAWINDR